MNGIKEMHTDMHKDTIEKDDLVAGELQPMHLEHPVSIKPKVNVKPPVKAKDPVKPPVKKTDPVKPPVK
ncbi:hypothetical protein GIW63_01095, partial [Pseudomonas syringae]|nr:hypothetical protein [Pseudomonas syringae]